MFPLFSVFSSTVFSVSAYRRKHLELYNSHDIFRVDNTEGYNIRQLSAREAQEDATKWLKNDGEVAVSLQSKIHCTLFIFLIFM
jgi:6-phosphofructo-2-kinase.